jgi:hypothetical protein
MPFPRFVFYPGFMIQALNLFIDYGLVLLFLAIE